MSIHQFLAQFPKQFRIFGGKALVQMNILAVDIIEIVERFH